MNTDIGLPPSRVLLLAPIAGALVIGAPKSRMMLQAFGSGDIEESMEWIRSTTGVEVVLVD